MQRFLIFSLILVLQSQISLFAQDEPDTLRMVVYPNMRGEYLIKGQGFNYLTERFIVDNSTLGGDKDPSKILKHSHYTNQTGFQFIFVHPKFLGFAHGSREAKDFTLPNNLIYGKFVNDRFRAKDFKVSGKASYSAGGWRYTFKLHDSLKNKMCIKPAFGMAMVKDFTMTVDVTSTEKMNG